MTKIVANLSTLFTQVPLIQRFALAKKAGFDVVEIQFPYPVTKEAIKQQLDRYQLTLVLINLPAGNVEQGELGIACLPQRKDAFIKSVQLAAQYAAFLGVKQVNCLAGIKPDSLSDQAAKLTFIANLRYAADYLDKKNIRLLIEAINTHDFPGFFLNSSFEAVKIIDEIDHPNLKFQFDVYHMQMMQGQLIKTIREQIDYIAHIQIADVPGRGEPGTGKINFSKVFNELALLGYTGYISLEYFPQQSTEYGLSKLAPLLNLKGE